MYANGNDLGDHNKTFFDLFKKMVKKNPDELILNPTRDDRYRFEKMLGRGASGLVYKAWDKRDKRHVAIKVSKKETDYFVPEARLAGKLEHENIVSIYDSYSSPGISYIIMEYIEGDTLNVFCARKNLLPLSRVSEVMIEICKGMHFAHTGGIIHRDIKPSNIMLTKRRTLKIMDFGTSQMEDGTQPLGFRGTPSYTSPEQIKSDSITKVSDIFSLGCVLYELIEGKKAFDGENPYTIIYKITNDDPAPLSRPEPHIIELFQPIILKALAKKAEDRYQNCRDLAYELSKTLAYLNRHDRAQKNQFLSTLKNAFKLG